MNEIIILRVWSVSFGDNRAYGGLASLQSLWLLKRELQPNFILSAFLQEPYIYLWHQSLLSWSRGWKDSKCLIMLSLNYFEPNCYLKIVIWSIWRKDAVFGRGRLLPSDRFCLLKRGARTFSFYLNELPPNLELMGIISTLEFYLNDLWTILTK